MTQTRLRARRIANKRERREAARLAVRAWLEYAYPTLTAYEREEAARLDREYQEELFESCLYDDEREWAEAYYDQIDREAIERVYYEELYDKHERRLNEDMTYYWDDDDEFCGEWWGCN